MRESTSWFTVQRKSQWCGKCFHVITSSWGFSLRLNHSSQVILGIWPSLSLIHWGRVMHICLSKLTIIGSDNGLSPCEHQAILWTNAGILLIGDLGINFSEILIEIYIFSLKKMHPKISSGKWGPFCLGLNVLSHYHLASYRLRQNGLSPNQCQDHYLNNANWIKYC